MIIRDLEKLKNGGRRLRARRVSEGREMRFAIQDFHYASKATSIRVRHGGSVKGHYYNAVTEGLVTVAFPNGYVYQKGARLNANNVTWSGVLAACLGEWARPYKDSRFSKFRQQLARKRIVAYAKVEIRAALKLKNL